MTKFQFSVAGMVLATLAVPVSLAAQQSGQSTSLELMSVPKKLGEFPISEIYFDEGVGTIGSDPNLASTLDMIAEQARYEINEEGEGVVLVGHAEGSLGEKAASDLSSKRALAVRDGLVARGIPVSRIEVRAVGKSQPRMDEDGQPMADFFNQRVEVNFILMAYDFGQ